MKFTFNLKGDTEFKSKLKTIRQRLGNPRGLYKSWGIVTMNWIKANYRTGGGKLRYGKWKGLTELTRMSRRKRSANPLNDTGHMMRQWSYNLKSWGVVVGNPMEIAKYHETGTGIYAGKGKYPIEPKNRKVLWFGVTPAQRRRGQQLGGHMQWRVASKPYRVWGKGRTPGIFARLVMHPGVPKRRQLPNEAEIMPDLMKTTNVWLKKAIK